MWRPPGREFACSPFHQGFSTSRLPQGSYPEVQSRNPSFPYPRSIPPGNLPLFNPQRSPFPFRYPVNQLAMLATMQRSPIPYRAPYQMPFLRSPRMIPTPVQMMNVAFTTSPSPGVVVPRPESSAFNRGPWNYGGSSPTGHSIAQEPLVTGDLDQHNQEKRNSKNSMLQGSTSMRQSMSFGHTSDKLSAVEDYYRTPPSLSQGKSHHYQPSPSTQTTTSPSSLKRTTFHRESDRKRHQVNRRGPRCYSPPPPEVQRVMKYVVPERFYTRSEKAQDAAFIVQGTDELRELHNNFEREILNMVCLVGQDDGDDDIWPLRRKENDNDKGPTESNLMDDGANKLNDRDSAELSSVSNYEVESDVEEGSQMTNVSSSESCEVDDDDGDDDDDDDDDNDNSNDGDDDDDDNYNDNEDDEKGEDSQLYRGPSLEETRKRKMEHPQRLHPELWFNEQGETNDGPVCRCSASDKKQGIRHGIYPGEKAIPKCNPLENNSDVLHHYWVTVTPHTNFMTENPTVIRFDGKDYTFEGFSLFSHEPVEQVPLCSVIRFNIEYFIHVVKEPIPQNFCVQDLSLFSQFLFCKVLELSDWDLNGKMEDVCERYHFMPRFVHRCSDSSDADQQNHELLSMNYVLSHILDNAEPLIKPHHLSLPLNNWEEYVKSCVNSIVRRPDKKPAAIRVDDLKFDKETEKSSCKKVHPYIVHHSIRPIQMSFAGDPMYQRLWKTYCKLRNLVFNTPVPRRRDEDKLVQLKVELATMRMTSSMRRDLLVEVGSAGMIKTGLKSDVCQHGLLLPVLVHHLRYHTSLHTLDKKMGYIFTNRSLLQLSLTHPSYHLNFGTNPDHARNSLSNCGVKQPRYGDRKIRHLHTRKKGITQLIRVMSNLGKMEEHQSMIRHNERLEYLGDAVLEFICSTHLYFMFPTNSEGGLAMYRSALVQNKHLAQLAKKLGLSDYMQYAHGPDLCLEEDLNHAMANCFEALLGALFLESGLESATKFFTKIAFDEEELREVWTNLPKHPLQVQQPHGDRHLVPSSTLLQKLVEFEKASGIEFTHIRLLARAFTHPQVGFNNLTLGSNQRMEFLGDSLFKFVVSEFLFKHFPDHHEGHLTLLRSSLVNRRIQASISRELGLDKLINFGSTGLKTYREKFLADVLEAFVAALYVDKDLKHVEVLCRVCLFPRLEDLIINQDWMDAKSQLQQCCLTFRKEGKEPDLPQYKVLQNKGPAHHKRYRVAVYLKGKRMGSGEGKSRRQAEMLAAKDALSSRYFPEMARQKHLLDRKHRRRRRNYWNKHPRKMKEKNSDQGGYEPRWEEKESFEERGLKRKFGDEND